MCGFIGILHRDSDFEIDRDLLERMNAVISHRGPDDNGIYIDNGLGFGHRRLAVIDLDNGHQPMFYRDKQRSIVYNGEIYNHLELRKSEFSAGSAEFETNCDTDSNGFEVV